MARLLVCGSVTGLCVSLAMAALSSGVDLAAQSSSASGGCATLLTTDALTRIVGETMTDMGGRQSGEGETECQWAQRGGAPGSRMVSVQFSDLRAIKASPSPTIDKYFETMASVAEGVASGKREVLAGVGQKAVLSGTGPQIFAVVQRGDGVARIVGNNLTKAQLVAVAGAVAAGGR